MSETVLKKGVHVEEIRKVGVVLTPKPTVSDKDSDDMAVKIRYLIDRIEDYQKLDVLSLIADYAIPAGETRYLPDDSGVEVRIYSKKTISFMFDASLDYAVEVSDDKVNWSEIYSAAGVTSGHPWFEADVLYVRLKVHNPLATGQKVIICTFKGRRLG